MVVHGGVDGYSRVPVYLHCSDNNQASTVLTLFLEAIRLPSRVRCDKGGENVEVAHYLLNHPLRGPGRGTVIAGKCPQSAHRENVEGCVCTETCFVISSPLIS